MDHLIEDLFQQEFFTIVFGIVLFYAGMWVIERDHAHSLKAWFHQNLDELFFTFLVGFALVSFDDVALRYLEKEYDMHVDFGRLVYLSAGPLSLLLIKGIKKLLDSITATVGAYRKFDFLPLAL